MQNSKEVQVKVDALTSDCRLVHGYTFSKARIFSWGYGGIVGEKSSNTPEEIFDISIGLASHSSFTSTAIVALLIPERETSPPSKSGIRGHL